MKPGINSKNELMTSDSTPPNPERAEAAPSSAPESAARSDEADGRILAEAERYGIDLTLLERNLRLSPTERLANLESAAELVQDLRTAMRQAT